MNKKVSLKILPPTLSPNQTPHFYFSSEWINETNVSSGWLSLNPVAHTDNGIQKKKKKQLSQSLPQRNDMCGNLFWSVMMASHYLETQKVCIHITTTELGRR